MNLYTALRDDPDSTKSALIGVFSTEERARLACQEDVNEDAEVSGTEPVTLSWTDTTASLPDLSVFDVILTDLDQRTGYSD